MTAARQGAEAERRVRRDLEAAGWWVTRAAGSKGRADLVAIRRWPPHGSGPLEHMHARPLGVQVKRSGWPGPAERAEMAGLYDYGVQPVCVRLIREGRRNVTEWRWVERDGTMSEPWRGVP